MLKKIHYIIVYSLILVVALTLVSVFVIKPVMAQDTNDSNLDAWGDPLTDQAVGATALDKIGLGRNDPRVIIINIIRIILGLLGVMAVLLIMYGGYVWMTAGGEPANVDKAKIILRNAVIGLLIVLSAFAIATFILNRLLYATGGNGSKDGAGRGSVGLGALGNGIIKSVYPEPGQIDVPMNTIIMVTFREEIDPKTICDSVSSDLCSAGSKILQDSIKIYKTEEGDGKNNVVDVTVASNDNRTFVFSPSTFLGSQIEPIDYSVYLTTDIKKADGEDAFRLAAFEWSFEVGTDFDLTPPQVVSIFPGPDNEQDISGNIIPAQLAVGSLEVNGSPRFQRANSVVWTKADSSFTNINPLNPAKNVCDGIIDISINNTTPLTANIAYNMPGYVDAPATNIINRKISTACEFDIELYTGFAPGYSWQITTQTRQEADILVINNSKYIFVNDSPQIGEIEIDSNFSTLAQRIKTAIDANSAVKAIIDPSNPKNIIMTAIAGGKAGNNIRISSSTPSLVISSMSGGTDKKVEKIIKGGVKDKPKNAIIQINFNEAINPLTVTGSADLVANYIKVVNLKNNSIVSGKFLISNQYRTVEFISDDQCAVNGCGEPVYCLPTDSELRVDLTAAKLTAVCTSDSDCLDKLSFNTCQANVCYNNILGQNYPGGELSSGVADIAGNSLDGNRDNNAFGPVSYYNENNKDVSKGDSYQWSFWISDILDLTPPSILSTNITPNEAGIYEKKTIEANFDKLLFGDSLSSGSYLVRRPDKTIKHQRINLWSLNKQPLGYWIIKQDKETSSPADNEPDETIVKIKHSVFKDSSIYRIQIGSGVKDIYQNCYKPSSSSSCLGIPSCCDGLPLADNKCPK